MADKEENRIPLVFVSYSHDSPEHKKWVGELSSKLVENGVNVILDQWDLVLGDDIPKFMEHGVTKADRVLMICTEPYVRKANEGEGGVGYEAMVVTGELARDLGTSKFIPVIRQGEGETLLPTFASTRYYVDLSVGADFDEQFESLLRELHQVRSITKPPLGKNPFARTPSGKETPIDIPPKGRMYEAPEVSEDAETTYKTALELARQGDLVSWRRIIRKASKPLNKHISDWREKYDPNITKQKANLPEIVLEGLSAYVPLFAIALAGVESGRDKFANQIGILDEILNPKDWNRGGLVMIVELPKTIACVYQAIHGALCLQTDQLGLAINLGRSKIETYWEDKTLPLYQNHKIVGWPETLGGGSNTAWNFLKELPTNWKWLNQVFGDHEDFCVALTAYYMSLNVLELADAILAGSEEILKEDKGRTVGLDMPLNFLGESWEVKRKAYRLLLSDMEQVKGIWRNLGIKDSKMEEMWPFWMRHLVSWLNQEHRYGFHDKIVIDKLFEDINQKVF